MCSFLMVSCSFIVFFITSFMTCITFKNVYFRIYLIFILSKVLGALILIFVLFANLFFMDCFGVYFVILYCKVTFGWDFI